MHFRTSVILLGALLAIAAPAYGDKGGKTHGDSCNILASGVQFFDSVSGGENNYANACDLEKGLVCAINKCSCPYGTEWGQNWLEQTAGYGGRCNGAKGLAGLGLGVVAIAAVVAMFR